MSAVTMDPTGSSRPAKRAIPVGLLEAALDSPTFRSTAIHFTDQIEAIEKWLQNYTNSTSKLLHDFLALEDTIHSYLNKTAPPVGDGLLDSDYTLLALKRVGEGSREWLTQMLNGMKRMDSTVVEPIRTFMNGDLRNFKDTRRSLETAQRTYDSTLARYVGQHKTKEPSSLREDAFSVFESHKIYLQASIEYCQAAPQIRSAIDRLLVSVCSDIWNEIKGSRDATANAMRWSREMDRVRGWSKEMESADAVFRRELQAAKKNIYDLTIEGVKPSRELEDYNVSTIPFLSSRGPVNMQPKDDSAVVSAKQGWLFLRVLSNKPTRYTWIRRWHYCREGVFGWLIPGVQGVLQGDEIGVLLCNARPAVGEERRFCFEIKTKDQSLILQTENQKELTEWLEVFEVTKKEAFETSRGRSASSMSRNDPAFSINPPRAPEFSANNVDTHINVSDDPAVGFERAGTMLMPPDSHATTRSSVDFNAVGTMPRRSFTALGKELSKDLVTREDGESGREHAARIIQKLDLHRKTTFGAGNEGALASPGISASSSGGIASLISSSHTLLPAYPSLSPAVAKRGSPLPKLDSQFSHLAPSTLEKSPVVTTLSRAAAIHAADRSPFGESRKNLPASIVANYWGTNIWAASDNPGQPMLPRREDDDPIGVVISEGTKTTLRTGSRENTAGEILPTNYPTELRLQMNQFKLLFPDMQGDEKLVLVFLASWSFKAAKGSEQDSFAGDGRVYVTPDYMYFYSQRMGLVTTFSISLDIITEVAANAGRDSDSITLRLGQDLGEADWEEVGLKVYLDDLRLLHSRLNLIIDNIQAEEPANTENLIFALINLEKADDRPSPSVDGWEDSSLYTPVEGGSFSKSFGRSPAGSTPRLPHPHSRQTLLPKIHLPSHPVEYEPDNMTDMAAERHFEISAKACFHVLFGDKSFVFPKLYFEHRAQQIAQGPWVLVDQGRMRREFQFKVNYTDMLGRERTAEVKDEQTIDLFSDHVTYVVTHNRTAWHLPHSNSFKLISKIVITHVAKSKCKLAIWVKIDWSRTPALSKNLVERQALRDVKSQAEELAELATDQVRKLGSRSRTNRAIHVYGHVGNQTQVVVFSPGSTDSAKKQQAVTPRTLTSMIFDTVRSFAESCITSVIMWTFAVIKRLFGILSAHRVIIVLLLLSGALNLLLTSSGTSTWWQERSAARFMRRIGVRPNAIMSKAIYFSDLAEATGASGTASMTLGTENSTCYGTFADLMKTTNLDAPWDESGGNMAPASRSAARRIRRTRQRLGTYRHDLVVAMRVVNSIEREMMLSEWENWLSHENTLCSDLGHMLDMETKNQDISPSLDRPTAQKVWESIPDHRVEELKQWKEAHCSSCRADHEQLLSYRETQFN